MLQETSPPAFSSTVAPSDALAGDAREGLFDCPAPGAIAAPTRFSRQDLCPAGGPTRYAHAFVLRDPMPTPCGFQRPAEVPELWQPALLSKSSRIRARTPSV